MTATRIAATPAAQSVIVEEALTASGWTAKRSRARDGLQVSHSITFEPPRGSEPVKLLMVHYPHDDSQLAEFLGKPTRGTGRSSVGGRASWRLSIFDASAPVIVKTARIAISRAYGPTFDTATWEGWESATSRAVAGHLESSTFVHPTGQVVATFHYPVAPGECGGWIISTPTTYADASGHTPGPLLRAFAESLLVS